MPPCPLKRKLRILTAAALLNLPLLLRGSPAGAEISSAGLARITRHLESLGYSVQKKEDRLLVTHPERFNFILREYRGGILLTSFLDAAPAARDDRKGYLEFINTFNAEAALARAYADKDGDFLVEAWMPGDYDKPLFQDFLEVWDADTRGQIVRKLAEVKVFLK